MKLLLLTLSVFSLTSSAFALTIDEAAIELHRCVNDDLKRELAAERIEWVKKCIEERNQPFLGLTAEDVRFMKFEQDETGTLVPRRRAIYPSFSDMTLTSTWKAPVDFTASCEVPSDIGVVGLCLSH